MIAWHTGWTQQETNNYSGKKMTTFFILFCVLLSGIIITTVQIRSTQKKEMNEIKQLFEEANYD